MGKSRQPPPPDPNVIAATQGTLNRQNITDIASVNRPQQYSPYGSNTWSSDPSGLYWTNTQTEDPRITNAFWRQLSTQDNMMGLADQMRGAISGNLFNGPGGQYRAFDPQNIPGMQATVDPGQTMGQVDLSGIQDLPGQNGFGAERQKVEDAMYGRQTAKLDPEYAKRQSALETQLLNQGFARGSEGFNTALADLGKEREQAYSGARNDSIIGGGQEQSRLFQDALAGRQQGVGERYQAGNFWNNANQQDYSQRFQSGQYQNASRQQRFGEELAKRNNMMNEWQQLLYGNSPNTPQIQGTAQIQGPNAPDFTSAAMGAYNGQVASANARQGNKNANTGAGASIASAAIMAF